MEDIALLKRCAMCPEMVIYNGPEMLSDGLVFCSNACAALWDAVTPGEWVDAKEIMRGGLFDRPDMF